MKKSIIYIKALFVQPDDECENKYIPEGDISFLANEVSDELPSVYLSKNNFTDGPLSELGDRVTFLGRILFESDIFTEDQIIDGNKDIQERIANYQTENNDLTSRYNNLGSENTKFLEEIQSLKKDYETMSGNWKRSCERESDLVKENHNLNEKLDNASAKMLSLKEDIKNRDAYINELLKRIPAGGYLNSEDVVKIIQAVKGITPSNKKGE